MSNVLLLTSSPRGEASYSTQIATELAGNIAGASITTRELWRNPLPHIHPSYIHAVFTPYENRTAEQRDALAASDALIAELKAADIVILAAGMINFGMPSTLKSWLDHVVRSGQTFRVGEAGPEGLVTGKKIVLVLSKGFIYSAGPMASLDSLEPYLRNVLGFLGMTDIETVLMEGSAYGPEATEKALAEGRQKATAVAASLSG